MNTKQVKPESATRYETSNQQWDVHTTSDNRTVRWTTVLEFVWCRETVLWDSAYSKNKRVNESSLAGIHCHARGALSHKENDRWRDNASLSKWHCWTCFGEIMQIYNTVFIIWVKANRTSVVLAEPRQTRWTARTMLTTTYPIEFQPKKT